MGLSLKKRGVLVQVLLSYGNTLFAVFSGLFFVPLYLKVSTVELYGAWLASGNLVSILGMFESGFMTVIAQRLAANHEDNNQSLFSKTVAVGFVFMVCLAVLIAIGGLLLSQYGYLIFKFNPANFVPLAEGIIYVTIATALSFLYAPISASFRAWHRNEVPAVISFVSTFLGLLGIYLGLFSFDMNIAAIGFGSLIRSLANCVGLGVYFIKVWHLHNYPRMVLDGTLTKICFKSSIPVFTTSLMSVLMNNSKELILAVLISPASAAVLSITNKLYSFGAMLYNPIANSFFSAFASLNNKKERLSEWILDISVAYKYSSSLFYGFIFCINYFFVSTWVGADNYGGMVASLFLGLSGWILVQSNFYYIVLNSTGLYKQAAAASAVDFIIRILLLLSLYALSNRFQLFMLPMAEVISMGVAIILIDNRIDKNVHRKVFSFIKHPMFSLVVTMLFWVGFYITIEGILKGLEIHFYYNGWTTFMITAVIIFLLIVFPLLTVKRSRLFIINAIKQVV